MKARMFLPLALTTVMVALSIAPAFAGGTSNALLQSVIARKGKAWPQGEDVPQTRNCATPEPSLSEQLQVQTAIRRYVEENRAAAVGGQIKVAFHVIYNGTTGNVPQSQVVAQIAELNKAYAGFYGGVNTGYTFVLASTDRTSNRKWFTMTPGTMNERNAKNALALDVPHRLNIYTCKPGQSLLGWAYIPGPTLSESDKINGVVIHYGSLPGGYLSPYDLGGTADHEVGHYLGLYHTFQGGCTAPGDQVADTPDEATATAGCPGNKDTCPTAGLDPIHNYMDYSDDACYTQFTAGQDARMDVMVPTYRPSLLNAAIAQTIVKPAAEEHAAVPNLRDAVSFRGAMPNPFRGSTLLRYTLPRSGAVSLRVYNVAGRLVRTLVDGEQSAGDQTVEFRANDLPAGMYFTALRVGGVQFSRSVILIR
jgi:Pregnancy-associated plasma protein-A